MKANPMFPKKTAFSCCFMMLLIFSSSSYAQIIYTDIADATPNATLPLDLNNDSIDDFIISYAQLDKVICIPVNNNAYSGDLVGGLHLPKALSLSDLICDTLVTWYDAATPGTMALGTSTGYWVGATDKYLALKLIVGTNTYYGWARFDVLPGSTSFTLKDYAYESTPNACIQAGQTLLGIPENVSGNRLSIFPNPLISSATIQTSSSLTHATLTLYNSYGQTVRQVSGLWGQTISISRDQLPAGIYFIQLTEADKTLAVGRCIISD